jgi:hypothetical protein
MTLDQIIDKLWELHDEAPDDIIDGCCPRCSLFELATKFEDISKKFIDVNNL